MKYARASKGLVRVEVVALQAKAMLVDGYKRLRTEDAVPGSSTSYRITVRQLEALVRLSEALARLRCTDVIQPQYVREVQCTSSRLTCSLYQPFIQNPGLSMQGQAVKVVPGR